ncbi:MAG: VRR-NUC domain-containing protein [Sphaerochaeta sp.]|nr:VRR-NUC domain-containing protein [Sphaerochaeta sp.]
MREKEIELQLVRAVKKMGGRAVKFMSPGFDGMPDRLVLLPGGKCGFVEVKAPGKKPRTLQLVRHEMLKTWGFKVYVLDAREQIEEIINDIYSA